MNNPKLKLMSDVPEIKMLSYDILKGVWVSCLVLIMLKRLGTLRVGFPSWTVPILYAESI